ncbi:LysR family transcriptional regulator [Burkholderia glumae]|uniref:LysR family transcriptional regulator n=1 Tax=Burkholderia glumae TaxID=337 RepID=A0AAP9Y6A2_BURGL|nr:LysR family transcriptional regulator [Burkholderia glumae]ACR28046.1 Transcriptional regulator, LysR family [Burkholderia glumae BGR1]AJY65533.1 bacterial regulatory helix-turn-helix, lysR family protein [Burkholderia glumae LMG 2196 = ATCC 33617]KHJ63367.1 LysR family transcriptional regulator [Burkholderia glumae]MCM2480972.1 LysR family transcriptional regulator [Burkholderia glumae]MCM2492341.1 LysR family transcriptional regulator [Burkholderia glumae]
MTDQIRTVLDWEDLRVFVALARHGSLSAAARALSVSHATISRRIQSLEHALGERLVERRPDGYVLTPAGTRALAGASEMETAAERLSRGGRDDSPRGLVRLNAPPSLVQHFLIARLATLVARHPSLDIDVASDFRAVSLDRREADIALRFGRPGDGDVIAKSVATPGYGFYATPQWASRLAAGEAPVFVGFDEANAHLPEAVWLARHFPQARVAIRGGSQLAQAAAARAGAGVALLLNFIGRCDAALVPCALGQTPPPRELWLLTRRDGRKDLPTRTVVDFLVQAFADEHDHLA